jgi:NAD(P)-dependent dehydrogenase (short-subunit alcohol dehydrogenase family)
VRQRLAQGQAREHITYWVDIKRNGKVALITGSARGIGAALATATALFGCVDLVCSNAGLAPALGHDAADENWKKCWKTRSRD